MCKELHEHLRNIALDLARHHAHSGATFDYDTDRALTAKFKRIERVCGFVRNRPFKDAHDDLCIDIATVTLEYHSMSYRDQEARQKVYNRQSELLDMLADLNVVYDEINGEADR